MTEKRNTSRRSVLALVGTLGATALAGCTNVSIGDRNETVELDGVALRSAVENDVSVPQTLPVDIASQYLDDSETRARELLDAVPALGPEEVPNGEIRERLARSRESAAEAVKRSTDAESPYQRLLELERARSDARFVAATWAAIDDGLTRENVVSGAESLGRAIGDFRERWQYVGSDPVRSVVVHTALERRVRGADSLIESVRDGRTHQPDTVLDVGELAEESERVQVNVADAAHLYDRYAASLDDGSEMKPTFVTARDALVVAVEKRTRERFGSNDDYPEPSTLADRDIGGTPAASLVVELARDLLFDDWEQHPKWVANDVTLAHEHLARHGALDAVLAEIADGEEYTVEDASDVVSIRGRAVEAVESALVGEDVSVLTRSLVSDVARRIEYADDRLADVDDTVPSSLVRDPIAEYAFVAEMAEATPAASERVEDELRSA
ncbi:hypothetical protein [Halogranum rubrum]|uniref:Uncharacterized protein n=1 Tax=Halogranum salarium B-1 TaxID=1210908 RepID=J2ZVQ3_9EURY|nr:hypothetical protein [Halogranum salarium]EJN57113.1 hypothetical protein HSB1_44990 [Halogranum salarium B-1]